MMLVPTFTSPLQPRSVRQIVRLMALSALMTVSLAHADDYSEVNQLIRSGKLPAALAKADSYLAGKPRDPQMRFLKGVIQTESGKATDAVTTFVKLTEDFPELPEPYNNLAVLYAGQSQFDKARAALEMAIRTNPSYATAHENLGDVYAKLASQSYSKALQLDSNNTAVQPKLALIRDLFSPTVKGTRPATVPVAAAPGTAVAPTKAATPPAAPAPVMAAAVPATAAASAPASPASAKVATAAPTPPAQVVTAVTTVNDKNVEAAVNAWATAWAAKDMTGYLAAYGKDFEPPSKQPRKAWEADRRARIVGKDRISLKLSNLDIQVNGNKATAKFRQEYKADALVVASRKTLELIRSGESWVIVRESTGG